MRKLRNICLCLFSLWLLGCSTEPEVGKTKSTKPYLYFFETGGMGGKGWDIWVEDLIINDRMKIPVGTLSGGTPDPNERLPGGTSAAMGKTPIPATVYAYWFSFRLQQFFDVTVAIPDEQQRAVKQLLKAYPPSRYSHTFILGVSGKGGVQFWWEVLCFEEGCPKNELGRHTFKHIVQLTPWVAAIPIKGNVKNHRSQTIALIKEGTLPEEIAYQLAFTYGLDVTNASRTLLIVEPIIVTSDTIDLETGADTGTISYHSEQKLDLLQPSPLNPPNNEPAFSSAAPQLMRLPHTVRVEWLNLVTQTAYAKTFNITQTQREQLFDWIVQYTEKRYSHTLTASVGDTGQVQLWWQIQCRDKTDCPETDTVGHSFELTPKTQADESWQNTEKHLEVIQALIASGQLPDGVLDLMPDEK
ncbi:MAG: hypothetical protein R3227_03200 [Reinekea sp.]|nr:hypothetical protein [Reinekea sp.]